MCKQMCKSSSAPRFILCICCFFESAVLSGVRGWKLCSVVCTTQAGQSLALQSLIQDMAMGCQVILSARNEPKALARQAYLQYTAHFMSKELQSALHHENNANIWCRYNIPACPCCRDTQRRAVSEYQEIPDELENAAFSKHPLFIHEVCSSCLLLF